jgi:pilus assembly protein CpaE
VKSYKILVLDRNEAVADQIRAVSAEIHPKLEVVTCTRIAEVGDMLTERGPFDVLVAGPSLGSRSGLSRLEIIHEELPAMSIVMAFTKPPQAQLRDVVRAGAVDLIQLPVEDSELVNTLERAIQLHRATAAAAPAPAAAPVPAVPAGPGTVFTIASATGGCGKTFYATNLAAFLSRHTGRRVCVIDIDLQFGEISTALRLRPKYTIYDALTRDEGDESDLVAHIEEYMVHHETGVEVLAAPKDPAEADRISPPDVTRIVEAARQRFDYVIVDTPAQLSEVVLAAFDLSERLYLMATLDLPSVRNMGVFLNTLEKLKIPQESIRLVLNKAESDVGIDVPQIERLFPQGFSSVLPYAKEVSRSINLGVPVLVSAPNAEVSRRLAIGLADLLPEQQRAALNLNTAPKGGLIGRLFGRSATSTPLVHQETT